MTCRAPHPASTRPGVDALDRIDDALDRILAATDRITSRPAPHRPHRPAQEGNDER